MSILFRALLVLGRLVLLLLVWKHINRVGTSFFWTKGSRINKSVKSLGCSVPRNHPNGAIIGNFRRCDATLAVVAPLAFDDIAAAR